MRHKTCNNRAMSKNHKIKEGIENENLSIGNTVITTVAITECLYHFMIHLHMYT